MKNQFRSIEDPMDDIIGRFLSSTGANPSEDEIIHAIDKKYAKVPQDLLHLKRQGYNKEQIMKILHIGEMSYDRALKSLKVRKKHG